MADFVERPSQAQFVERGLDGTTFVFNGENTGIAVAAASAASGAATSAEADRILAQTAAGTASDEADRAEAAAATAVNAPGTSATSATSLTVGTGSKSLTVQTGKLFVPGQFVTIARTSATTTFMHGQVTSYNSGTGALVVNVSSVGGSGTFTDWTISLSGPRGAQGASGSGSGDLLAANNLSDLADAATARTNLGLGTAAEEDVGAFAAASHTHTTSAITDFAEAVDDRVAALLVEGDNITLTYNDVANTLTIDAAGGGGQFFTQGTPPSVSHGTTLAVADMLTGMILLTGGSGNLTLPTGSVTDAAILGGALAVDQAFDWTVVNTINSDTAIVGSTGHTFVGADLISRINNDLDCSVTFRTRKTAANTFVTYRLG